MDICILIVSGEELWGIEKIRLALFEAGYKVTAAELDSVGEIILHQKPALIIANLSGKQPEDLELCHLLHRLSDAPIIAISPSADETFRVGMLAAFADDYLVRPVNPRELSARVRNILRRTLKSTPAAVDRTPFVSVELKAINQDGKPYWWDKLQAFAHRVAERRSH